MRAGSEGRGGGGGGVVANRPRSNLEVSGGLVGGAIRAASNSTSVRAASKTPTGFFGPIDDSCVSQSAYLWWAPEN